MKKALSILLIVAVLLSTVAVVTLSASADEAQRPSVDAILGTPTIDGEVDAIWAKASVQEVKNASINSTTSTVQFRTMYDSNNVYYLFDVLDSTPTTEEFDAKSTNLAGGNGAGFIWKDSIMLVMTIPMSAQKEGATKDLGFQAVITSYGRVLHQTYTVPEGVEKQGITAKSTIRKDAEEKQIGFYLEVQVPLANDWNASMAKGSSFLTAINYNDNFGPDSTTRNAALAWSDNDGNAWGKPEQRGTVVLDAPVSVAAKGTPTIDGTVDEVWATAKAKKVTNPSSGVATPKGPSDAIIEFRTLYDENNVYYLFDVLDGTPTTEAFDASASGIGGFIARDSFMLVMTIPMASQKTGAAKDLGFQAVITSYGKVLHQTYSVPEGVTKQGITAKATIRKDADEKQIGYYLEVQVPLANDWNASMADGSEYQVAVIYNDNFGPESTSRDAQISWSDTDGGSWGTPAKRGTVKLPGEAAGPVDPPEPPQPATIDTTRPVAYAAKGTPVIDGTIDEVWATTKLNQYTAESIKPSGDYADYPVCQPTFRILWDDNSVYFLFVVVDTSMGPSPAWEDGALGGNLWRRDSVMLSFDLNYSRDTTSAVKTSYDFQMIISAYGNTANYQDIPKSVFIETGEGENVVKNYAISYINYNADQYHCFGEGVYPGAYVIEMKMNLKDYYPELEMKENNFIGFYTIVNDNFAIEAEASRNYQTTWFDAEGKGWNNRAEQGSILFVNTVDQPDALTDIVLIDADEIFNLKPGDNTNPGTNTGETTTTATETPTSAPEPGTKAPEPDTKAPEKTKKKGCGSTVAGSSIALVSLVTLGFAFVDKKKRK